MRAKIRILTLIAVSLLSACAVPPASTAAQHNNVPQATQITQMIGSWLLVELNGVPLGANIRPASLNIDGTRLHGSSGCNHYFGTLGGTMANLSFSQLGATKMACLNEDVLINEHTYFNVLGAAKSATISQYRLSLYDANGVKTAVFVLTPD